LKMSAFVLNSCTLISPGGLSLFAKEAECLAVN
jgi:hypothetical protein